MLFERLKKGDGANHNKLEEELRKLTRSAEAQHLSQLELEKARSDLGFVDQAKELERARMRMELAQHTPEFNARKEEYEKLKAAFDAERRERHQEIEERFKNAT